MTAKRSTATAALPILILPDALYTTAQVQRLLGVCKSTLLLARQSQGLVASRRAGRDWYFGSDLLAWLRGGRCSRGGADAVEGGTHSIRPADGIGANQCAIGANQCAHQLPEAREG